MNQVAGLAAGRAIGGTDSLPRPRLRWVFSLETLIVLLLFQGLRDTVGLSFAATDVASLTVWVVCVAVGVMLLSTLSQLPSRAVTIIGIASLLAVDAWISLLWTPSHVYALQKAVLFVGLNLWLLAMGATIVSSSRVRLARLGIGLYFAAALAAGAIALSNVTAQGRSASAFGVEYGVLGALVAVGTLLGLAHLILFTAGRLTRSIVALMTVTMMWALFIGGQRQGLLGTALAGLVFLLARSSSGRLHRHPALRFAVVVSMLAGVAYFTVQPSNSVTLLRLEGLVGQGPLDTSTAERLLRYRESPSLWAGSFIQGKGLGSWPVLAGFGDTREYPHNLILEIGTELGVIGLLLFFGLIGYALVSLGPWRWLRQDPYGLTILVLLVFTLGTAQVSGGI